MVEALSLIQNIVTYILIGLIWTIQMVHYPAFRDIDQDCFIEFEKKHTTNISLLVVPLMLLELLAAIVLVVMNPEEIKNILILKVVLGIWLSTFLLSVPCHQKLTKGKDLVIIDRLVRTNWIRTILWSIKGVILLI